MYLKFKCLIIFSCFLTTLSKHFLIETDDKVSTSNPDTSTDTEEYYDDDSTEVGDYSTYDNYPDYYESNDDYVEFDYDDWLQWALMNGHLFEKFGKILIQKGLDYKRVDTEMKSYNTMGSDRFCEDPFIRFVRFYLFLLTRLLTIGRKGAKGCGRQRKSCKTLKVTGPWKKDKYFYGSYEPVMTKKGSSTTHYKKKGNENYFIKLKENGKFVIRRKNKKNKKNKNKPPVTNIIEGKYKAGRSSDLLTQTLFSKGAQL